MVVLSPPLQTNVEGLVPIPEKWKCGSETPPAVEGGESSSSAFCVFCVLRTCLYKKEKKKQSLCHSSVRHQPQRDLGARDPYLVKKA